MSITWRSLSRIAFCILSGCLMSLLPLESRGADAQAPASTKAADAPASADKEPGKKNDAEKPQKHVLRFKFKADQTVRYEITSKMEMKTIFNGLTEQVRNSSDVRKAYKVTSVNGEGEGSLEMVIEWTRMIAEFDDGVAVTKRSEFQSDDPMKRPAQFLPIYAKIGRPQALIRFNALGRPLEVKPLLVDREDSKTPLAALGSADAPYESYLVPLPEDPVAVGDTWKESFQGVARDAAGLPMRIAMQRVYKLNEVKDGQAQIGFRTVILTPIQDPAVQAQILQRETAGQIVFDVEQGQIVSRDVSVDKLVVNPFGQGSSMKALTTFREKLIPADLAASRDEAAKATNSKQ